MFVWHVISTVLSLAKDVYDNSYSNIGEAIENFEL